MIIRKLKIKKFKDINNAEAEFPASGITLVYGNTGSGKSSLIDAIYSAIFIPSTNKIESFWNFSQPAGTELSPEITLEFEKGEDTFRLSKKYKFGNGTKNSSLEKRNLDGSWREIDEGGGAEEQILRIFDEKLRLKAIKPGTSFGKYVEGNDMPFSGLFRVFYQQQRDLGSMVQKSNPGKNEDEKNPAFSNSISDIKGVSVIPPQINAINNAINTNLKNDLEEKLGDIRTSSQITNKLSEYENKKRELTEKLNFNEEVSGDLEKIKELEGQNEKLILKQKNYTDLKEKNTKFKSLVSMQERINNLKSDLNTIIENKKSLEDIKEIDFSEKKYIEKKKYIEEKQTIINDAIRLNYINLNEEKNSKIYLEIEENTKKIEKKLETFKKENKVIHLPNENDYIASKSFKIEFNLNDQFLPIKKEKDGYADELKGNLDFINEDTKYIIENVGNIEITFPEGQKKEGIEEFKKKFGHIKDFSKFYNDYKDLKFEIDKINEHIKDLKFKVILINTEDQSFISSTSSNQEILLESKKSIEYLKNYQDEISNNIKKLDTKKTQYDADSRLIDNCSINIERIGNIYKFKFNKVTNLIEIEKLKKEINSKFEDFKTDFIDAKSSYEKKYNEQFDLDNQIEEDTDFNEVQNDIDSNTIKIERTKAKNIEQTKNLTSKTVSEIKEELKEMEQELKNHNLILNAKLSITSAFDVFKKEYEGSVSPFIKEIMDEWLNAVFGKNGKSAMEVDLNPNGTLRGIKKVNIGANINVKGFSKGEEQAINTLLRLAIGKILNESGKYKFTQVIDDPITNLDSDKIDALLKIINDLSNETPIIMIAVNNLLIENYKKLKIKKRLSIQEILN